MLAVVQARMGSTRLPNKVAIKLGDKPVLGWVVRAAHASPVIDQVVVATSSLPQDDVVASIARSFTAEVYRGEEADVLSRFMGVVDAWQPASLVRLTADCPLLDPCVITSVVHAFEKNGVDYASTALRRHLPRGLDVEVVKSDALSRAAREARGVDRVHVTSYLYRKVGAFNTLHVPFGDPAPELRVTLDTEEDLRLLERLVALRGNTIPRVEEIISLLRAYPELAALNALVHQKEIEEG